MNTEITIRGMLIEDAGSMAELERKVFSEPWSCADFEKACQDSNYIYIVALDKTKIVGYAGCVISYEDADITNIAVEDEYRRMGIAETLLEVMARLTGEKGVSNIFLEVRESNQAAKSLYVKKQFTEIGIRKNFYRFPTEDAILMKRIL